jgi:hypothetical protein
VAAVGGRDDRKKIFDRAPGSAGARTDAVEAEQHVPFDMESVSWFRPRSRADGLEMSVFSSRPSTVELSATLLDDAGGSPR